MGKNATGSFRKARGEYRCVYLTEVARAISMPFLLPRFLFVSRDVSLPVRDILYMRPQVYRQTGPPSKANGINFFTFFLRRGELKRKSTVRFI